MRTPLNVYIQGFAAITKFLAAIVQERPLFKKYFFNPKFAAIIQERPLFESDRYWRGYGIYIANGIQKSRNPRSKMLICSFQCKIVLKI